MNRDKTHLPKIKYKHRNLEQRILDLEEDLTSSHERVHKAEQDAIAAQKRVDRARHYLAVKENKLEALKEQKKQADQKAKEREDALRGKASYIRLHPNDMTKGPSWIYSKPQNLSDLLRQIDTDGLNEK